MKNVTIVITSKVLYIDKTYPINRYEKVWFQAAPIMDESKNQVDDIAYYNIITNLFPNMKNNFKHG
jgi:hypothetical protein